MNHGIKILIAGLIILLTACGPRDDADKVIAIANYKCEDGSQLFAQFKSGSVSIDAGNGRPMSLPQQRSASGIWYSSGQYELRGKGREATWTMGRRTPTKCLAE